MANLTVDRHLPAIIQGEADGIAFREQYTVKASETIYKGAFVELDAGGLVQKGNTGTRLAAVDQILGVALAGAAASETVEVLVGPIISHALTSVAKTDIGKIAYASDDQTLTLTSTGNVKVGRIVNVPATGTCHVAMQKPGFTI